MDAVMRLRMRFASALTLIISIVCSGRAKEGHGGKGPDLEMEGDSGASAGCFVTRRDRVVARCKFRQNRVESPC